MAKKWILDELAKSSGSGLRKSNEESICVMEIEESNPFVDKSLPSRLTCAIDANDIEMKNPCNHPKAKSHLNSVNRIDNTTTAFNSKGSNPRRDTEIISASKPENYKLQGFAGNAKVGIVNWRIHVVSDTVRIVLTIHLVMGRHPE